MLTVVKIMQTFVLVHYSLAVPVLNWVKLLIISI